jgi:hypothetical protein
MFSSRFHWDAPANRVTELLTEKRRNGARILDLSQSNPTQAGLTYPDYLAGSFGDVSNLIYEPQPAGSAPAREAVSAYYASRGIVAAPDRILLTASTSEGYAYLFKLLCDSGDEVLVPRPSYPLFELLAQMESVAVTQYPLIYDYGWSIDTVALAAAVGPRTRAIVVVNPNNPTGSYLKRSELDALEQLCGSRGLVLISDEVFSDYALTDDAERVVSVAPDCAVPAFSMSGLSKIAGLPQMKLGWIVAGGPEGFRTKALERLEWIADTYLSVSTPVQNAAARLLEAGDAVQSQIRQRTEDNLRVAAGILNGSPANLLQLEGGWYVTLAVPRTRTEEEWTLALLREHSVLVQPGFFFDFESEAYLVASLLTAPEILREGMARLRRLLDS